SKISLAICSEERDDSSANFLTSSATTENPFPASPALAASMAAFKAKRLVCSAMVLMLSTIFSISSEFLFSLLISLYVSCVESLSLFILLTASCDANIPFSATSRVLLAEIFILLMFVATLLILLDISFTAVLDLSIELACLSIEFDTVETTLVICSEAAV